MLNLPLKINLTVAVCENADNYGSALDEFTYAGYNTRSDLAWHTEGIVILWVGEGMAFLRSRYAGRCGGWFC